jgi:aminoglycoside 6'-N-acetyltransferase
MTARTGSAPTLQGDRVRLRAWRDDDLDRLEEILAQPSVARWWTPGEPGALATAWVADEGRGSTTFVIEVDGRVVGSVQAWDEEEPDYRSAGIDIFLADEGQGVGLGPDAIRTLARWLFTERGHHRLTIDPAAANERAIRAYRKVGFRPIGVARLYERGQGDTWHDGLLMDLLREDLTGPLG